MPSTDNPYAPSHYDPYGTPNVAASMQYGYRSEIHLGTRIHLRNRTYTPTTGTFTTPDPLDGITGTTTETNPYHYTNNNPINLTDPLGLSPDDCGVTSPFEQGRLAERVPRKQRTATTRPSSMPGPTTSPDASNP
ncbi:MAG: RHS repeat-associated core domain-containing protein [Microthrixaceae bacterium]